MAARIKSRVMNREEKAFGAIDMNRMMTAGMGTGFVYALLRLIQAGLLLIPAVIVSFFFFVWLTGRQGGVPRYMVFVYSWQAKILIAAGRNPQSLSGRIASLADWDTSDLILNGDLLFTTASSTIVDETMSGLEILDSDALDAGGFEIVSDDELFITIK
ncbi:MAG: hypothetical protein Q9P01_09235 [Anaerolineae bacterium]|nr:hypothetical protein [Anaerolineae bacterium]MDQ7034999.1 hypothetical protein [Anaerolineae bacterium]